MAREKESKRSLFLLVRALMLFGLLLAQLARSFSLSRVNLPDIHPRLASLAFLLFSLTGLPGALWTGQTY